MGELTKRLRRDKYIEVFLEKSGNPSPMSILGKDGKYYTFFSDPSRNRIIPIESDEDRNFLSEWLGGNPDIKLDNEAMVVKKGRTKVLMYYRDKCKFINCKNVVSFLTKVSKLTKDKNLYYRGQSSHYEWIPSLYRKKAWVEHEAILNARVISRHVDEFKDCQSTIERLIKLKHFNQPSRLYDIVANPLMALFFACDSGIRDKSDGMIAVVFSDKAKEKYSVLSDTVTELSSLSNVDRFEQLKTGLLRKALCFPREESGNNVKNCYSQEKKTLEQDKFKVKGLSCSSCGIVSFLCELAHQCKKESGIESYWDDVSMNKIDQCIVVHPELNNARITQQQGLFILCGLNTDNPYEPPQELDSFFYENGEEKTIRTYIRFPNNCLGDCMRELNRLGINRSQVYFDLEKTIEFEREKIIGEV